MYTFHNIRYYFLGSYQQTYQKSHRNFIEKNRCRWMTLFIAPYDPDSPSAISSFRWFSVQDNSIELEVGNNDHLVPMKMETQSYHSTLSEQEIDMMVIFLSLYINKIASKCVCACNSYCGYAATVFVQKFRPKIWPEGRENSVLFFLWINYILTFFCILSLPIFLYL